MRCEASGGHSWLAAWPRLLSPLGDGVLAVRQHPATSLFMILPEFPLPQTWVAFPGKSPSTQQVLSYNGGEGSSSCQKNLEEASGVREAAAGSRVQWWCLHSGSTAPRPAWQ